MNSSATMAAMKTASPNLKISQSIAYFVAFIALGFTTASLGPTLQNLADHLQTTLGAISFLFTARSVGFLLGSFRGGRLYDHLRGHPVMALMIVVMSAMMMLTPFAPNIFALTVVMLVLGAAEGLLDVGGNTLIVWIHENRVAPFMNALHFFYGLGATIVPLIITRTLQMKNALAVPYMVLALLVLPVALLLMRLPSPAMRSVSAVQSAEKINYRLVILIAFFLGFYVGGEVAFGSWIFNYTVKMNLGDETVGAYLTSLFWGSFTTGRLLGIPVAARFKPNAILSVNLLGWLVSIVLILSRPESFAALLTGTIGLGISMASIYPTVLTIAERRMKITGRVTGFFIVGASLGAMVLPFLVGQLFGSIGAQGLIYVVLGALFFASLVFGLLNFSPDQQANEKEVPATSD
jgi:MFS transporter, FHS family, Na+ dependent glucose transporter 1